MLTITDLHVDIGNLKIIQGITLDIKDGEIVSLIGANGAGKTTLIRAISGLGHITGGTVKFMDRDITGATTEQIVDAGLIQIPEGRQLFSLMTVRENLEIELEGKNMNELFKERFFGKFGMESSTAYWTPAVYAAFSVGFAKDGSIRKVKNERRVSGNAPEPNAAWSLYSYSAEYARFLCAMINDKGGLSDAAFAEMTRAQNKADDNIHWGLGFGIYFLSQHQL